MKNILPALACITLLAVSNLANGQNLVFSRYIIATDTIEDNGVTFAASSDDAEQENDAIDALFDDDLDAGWEGDPADQNTLTTGLRFQHIFLPQGAIIDSAFIIVYSHEAKTAADVANITIAGEAADHTETFNETDLITDRPRTSAQVSWVVAEEWGLWTPHRTPDLKSIVQETVNRSGWASGNALSFFLLGENQGVSEDENAREMESFENIADPEDGGDGQNHPERVPQLVVYYSVQNGEFSQPIIATTVIEDNGVFFSASSDDAEQENDEMDSLFDDDLDAGWEGAPEDQNILTTGLRFQHVGIPKGAVIQNAYIEVYSHESKTAEDVARITIFGEATDHAETFTEDALITARPKTSASELWEVAEEWGLWTPHQTPDLKGIVQEIVNRPGWEAGNAIAFLMLGENQGVTEVENAREWESYENIADPEDGGDGQNHPERVPRLFITYSSPNLATSVFEATPSNVKSLTLYPNPASQFVTLELDNEAAARIRIFNGNGQLVKLIETDRQRVISLPTGDLNEGVYTVQAEQDGVFYVQKLVLSR
ncbi:MAG: T9SS type A sorting domain-containing protein [Lewinellaceae bacterium]|nr:T9SS type A sorting domain-containing protein [Saprospiraceae bacterium]MCB9340037.1 T9SS type A sorting domain-containing protein [Lewinellaceae bacterium]